MPGRGTSDDTVGDHLQELCSGVSHARMHVEEAVQKLEDGGTPFDHRVKHLEGALAILEREARALADMYDKNNPR